jgi:hypothetical protein
MEKIEEFCREYLKIWIGAMLNENSGLLKSWHGSLHEWTVKHMANVLYPLADTLYPFFDKFQDKNSTYGYTRQQEYYNVDFSLYRYYGLSVWTLDFAVEHENAEFSLASGENIRSKGWYDEFAKLLPLKCAGARVIIGYDKFDRFDDKVKKCLDLLNDKRIEASLADSPILLIIFPRTDYMKKFTFEKGIIRLVKFYKQDTGDWEIDDVFEKNILDSRIIEGLKQVYQRIAN